MVRVNEDLTYWIGVVQTDGSLTNCHGLPTISFTVGEMSLPMLEKFRRSSKLLFNRNNNITIDNRGYYGYKISAKKLMEKFDLLDIRFGDPPTPPKWVTENPQFLGSYLAGVIDGDGDVRIKRPENPQCVIRVTSGKEPKALKSVIKNRLNCGISSTHRDRISWIGDRMISGNWYETEFYVSKKNEAFIRKFVLPHMRLKHKSEKITRFIS